MAKPSFSGSLLLFEGICAIVICVARPASKTALLLALFVGSSGCALRRPTLSRNYRLAGFPAGEFILPPDFSDQQRTADHVRIPLGKLGPSPHASAPANCSIHDRFFSFDRPDNNQQWVATVPTPLAWNQQELAVHGQAEWSRFLTEIEALEAAGCISPEAYEKILFLLEESMPAPAVLDSFFRDPLGNRGFVALRPGMRLFIERSIFHNAAGPESVANYWGETKIDYRVLAQPGGKVSLKLARVQRSRGLPRKAGREFPDTRLAPQFQHMGALRLILLTLYVPPSLKRNGLLVGVRDPGDMVAILREIIKNPKIPCRQIASADASCATFEGMVSASAEIDVTVNGKEKYFPIGTQLGRVVDSLPSPDRPAAWQTLRLRRLFRGKLYDVEFHRRDPELARLALFAGDRISWRLGSPPR